MNALTTSTTRSLPPGTRAVRIVGDVHGDAAAFAYAAETDRFVVQLGDLTDSGPDSGGALRIMLRMIDQGRGLFLLGNHDQKLRRALLGQLTRIPSELAETLSQLDESMRSRMPDEIARAPAWLRAGSALFVHGGFDPRMLEAPAPLLVDGRPEALTARALYGQLTGRMQGDGFPERIIGWVDRIPARLTVYCGHDRRSPDGRPYIRRGASGGTAVFMDTGAGKGGHLSWLDVDLNPPG